MATFTWIPGTNADWNTLADWSLSAPATVPGSVAANKDVVSFGPTSNGSKTPYVVGIATKESFDVATINIADNSNVHSPPSLSITGSLFTDTLAYGTSALTQPVGITINAGGLFDIRTSITNASNVAETITIAGTGIGGHLDLGSASQSGITVNQANVTLSFSNNVTGKNAGVIEYLSGFDPTGTHAVQHISGLALGDGIIFDGADFTGDTFTYGTVTHSLNVTNGTTNVLTINNLSGPGLKSSSFLGVGNEIVVAPVGSFTWAATTSGNWNDPARWTPNNNLLFPGSADNNPSDTALIAVAGTAYKVSYNVPSNTIAALTVGFTNATLAFDQAAAAALTVTGATILSAGTISVTSSTATLSTGSFAQTGGTFTQTAGAVNVTGLAGLAGSDSISGGKFNAGTLTVGNNLSFLAGTITSGAGGVTISSGQTVTINAPADLNATIGGLTDSGTIIGSGTIDGAISGSGFLTAKGGTLDLTGTVNGPTLAIDTSPSSDLKIDGTANSPKLISINSSNQTLEIGASGALTLTGQEAVSAGAIKMDGGTLTDSSGILFSNKGSLSGSGTLAANLTGDASDTVQASGGTLDLTGTFGSGLVAAIDASSTSNLKFDNTGTLSAPISITSSNQTLEVGTGGNLTITGAQSASGGGTIKLDGGTFVDSNGTTGLTVGSGGTLTGSGTAPNDITLTGGTVSQSGGVLNALFITGFGTVNGVTGAADIVASGGTLDLTGTVSGAQLVVDPNIGGVLKVDGNVTAGDIGSIDLHSANQTVEIGTTGTLALPFLETVSNGTIKLDGGTLNATGGLIGTLTKNNGVVGIGVTLIGKGIVNGGTISGSGVVEGQGGVLTVSNNVTSNAIVLEADSVASSVLALDSTVTSGISFDYLNTGGVFSGGLLLGNTTARTSFETGGTIVGMHVGSSATATTDFIDIAGVVPGGFTEGIIVGSTIELFNGATPVDHFTLASAPGANTFVDWQTDGSGGTDVFLSTVTCFVAGTRVLTVTGERTVDSLMQGDIMLTLADGELVAQPVRWVGQRRIDLTAHPRPETMAPIRIRRGAFTDNMPHADLLVSPDHAVFVDGKLICARQLINGTTIRAEMGWTAVEYFHVELDAHAILFAEGLPAESYLDTGNRGFFANGGEPLVLHPDLTDESDCPTRAAGSCAPFVSDEASVLPVWQRLVERAAALGQPAPKVAMTADPEVRLVAKGRTLRPLYGENGLYIFALPKGATEVRLVSRSAAPTDARPWLDDRRCLGVNVERIVLRGASELREVPVDHPGLSRGWHAVERDGVALRRWTTGDAVLPLPALTGPTMLEIRASNGGMAYLADAEQEQRAA